MLIKRQFHYAFAAVISALLAVIIASGIMHQRLQEMEDVRGWANDVVETVFDCNVLGTESILQDNERAREQYKIAAQNLDRLLNNAPDFAPVKPMLESIRASKHRLDTLLLEFENKPRAPIGTQREEFDLQMMVVSQWMMQTRVLLDSAHQMRRFAATESGRIRLVGLWADTVALTVVALVTGWVFWTTYRTLVTPLERLSEGARRVGAGDLMHRLPTPHDNEISQAAQSFNRMTEQLSQREAELKEKLRDLEAFCYSVAHDLKAPLRSVAGFGGLLEEEYKDALDDEGRSYIERMQAGSTRMSALIDDLLKFGQLTHQRVELSKISLKDVCDELLLEMQAEVAAANGTIKCGGLSCSARGNAFLLKQALTNLVGNALKFVRAGTPPVIELRAHEEDSWIVLEIEDNGIGIPEEFHQKIFGLFHRLHEYRDYPGTGIGLAIVQKCIERMGGQIGLRSAPGKGTTFWIRLRAA